MDAKQLIQAGLGTVTRATDRALDGLTVAELEWQPRPDANFIGEIRFHMARSEDSYIHSLIQHKSQIWETEKWYDKLLKDKSDAGSHYSAEQVASFRVPDIKDLKDYSTAVRQKTLEFFKDLTPEKLDMKVDLPQWAPPPASAGEGAQPHRLPFEPVVGLMLMMNVTHLAQHAGEIGYLRGLQRGMDK